MPKWIVRVESTNVEVHLVSADDILDENEKNVSDFDETEIKRIMKKEISKPLLLVRSE